MKGKQEKYMVKSGVICTNLWLKCQIRNKKSVNMEK